MNPELSQSLENKVERHFSDLINFFDVYFEENQTYIDTRLESWELLDQYVQSLARAMAPHDMSMDSLGACYRGVHFGYGLSDLANFNNGRFSFHQTDQIFSKVNPTGSHPVLQDFIGQNSSIAMLTDRYMQHLDPRGNYPVVAQESVALTCLQLQQGKEIYELNQAIK